MRDSTVDRGPRIVFVTQKVDPADPVLGFVVGLIQALAARCDELAVVANEVTSVPTHLGAEVFSLGKENGAGRFRRGARYELLLWKLAKRSPDVILAHMCPQYLDLAAPLARVRGIPTLLWYVHSSYRPSLRLAERLANGILTCLPGAYPGSMEKVHIIGHAIDVNHFSLKPVVRQEGPLRLVTLGRTSPAKGLPVTIRAVAILRSQGMDVCLRVVGPSTTPEEEEHRKELERLVADLGVGDDVKLQGPGSPESVRDVLVANDILLSAAAVGSADKVVFQAMAVGRPVLVSNPVFAPLLRNLPVSLLFREGDAQELASLIVELSQADSSIINLVGGQLRKRVEADHSITHWTEEVLRVTSLMKR